MNKLVSGIFLLSFGLLGQSYGLTGPDLAIAQGMMLIGALLSIGGTVELIHEIVSKRLKRQ